MNKRKAEILYRSTRYGKWNSLEIVIPKETKNVKEYVHSYLGEIGIGYLQMQVIKTKDL